MYLSILLPVIFFLLSILIIAAELYFRPQMYFYDFIISYFPGTVYDELIEVDYRLVSFRLLAIFLSLSIALSAKIISNTWKKVLFSIVLVLLFAIAKPFLGYSSTISSIKDKLKGNLVTEHFNILYDKEIDSVNISYFVQLHEFYYNEMGSFLGKGFHDKITSVIFRDSKQKRELFGASNADVAKPWLKQIYITENSVERTLKHELSHIFMGIWGNYPLLLAKDYNPFLIEGFATAITNNFNDHSVHYPVKLALDSGFEEEIKSKINGLRFFNVNPSIAYAYSGSFIKYLLDNYPMENVLQIYGSGNFNILDRDINTLTNEYLKYMENLPAVKNYSMAEYYFGGAPLIRRKCVRSNARFRKIGWEHVNDEDYSGAVKYFNLALKESLDFSSLNGLLFAYNQLSDFNAAESLLTSNKSDFENTRWKYPYKYLLAKAYYFNGKKDSAAILFDMVVNSNFHPTYIRSSKIYIELMKDSINIITEDTLKIREYYRSKLFDNKNAFFVLPLLNSIKDLSGIKNIISSFALQISEFSNIDIDLLIKLSRIARKYELYDDAYIMAEYAMEQNSDFYRTEILREEIRKIEWLKKAKK